MGVKQAQVCRDRMILGPQMETLIFSPHTVLVQFHAQCRDSGPGGGLQPGGQGGYTYVLETSPPHGAGA